MRSLYSWGGWEAPLWFAMALLIVDIVMRLLIIEVKDARRYGHQPKYAKDRDDEDDQTEGSTWRALAGLLRSPRFASVFYATIATGFVIGALFDAALTLNLKSRFGFDSAQAGLTFLAVVAPGALIMPLAGRATDRIGAKAVGVLALTLCAPATAVLAVNTPLAPFIALLVVQGASSSVLEPAMSQDLAQQVEEGPAALGFAHVYAASNLAFSLGQFVGPLVAGALLDRFGPHTGFQYVALISGGLFAIAVPLWALFIGGRLKPPQPPAAAEGIEPPTESDPLLPRRSSMSGKTRPQVSSRVRSRRGH